MKRLVVLVIIVAVTAGALYVAEHRRADAPVSPDALLHFIGDTQRELTHLPASATRISDEEEIRFGQEMARRIDTDERRQESNTDPDRDAVQQYINRVGGRLATHARRKLPYSFHYIPDPHFVNAFALPGGPVFIGGGLMSLMDSEDELASVLGHEIEHIDHYHAAERVQIEARTRRLGLGRLVVEIPIMIFQAGYTKEQELQADSEGTRLAVQAGYSPLGSIRMFEAFDRAYHEASAKQAASPQQEIARVALQTLEGYFRSHPPSAERAQRIRDLMAAEHWPAKPERDLEVGWVFAQLRADDFLRTHKYAEAQAQAEHVLKLKPGNMKALWTLSRAQLLQGDFLSASANLREMLAQEPHSLNLTYQYAHALAGVPNHALAARDFEEWLNSPQAGQDPLLSSAVAGLKLLAGDERPAQTIASSIENGNVDSARASELGYLGWWFYLAGRYDTAADLLTRASNMLPGNAQYTATLGWTNIERQDYADALRQFGAPTMSAYLLSGTEETAFDPATSEAGAAVALWLGNRRNDAVARFGPVYDEHPEWRNPRWVRATYSSTVWRTVSQISAEIERTRKPNLRASAHPAPN
ncbi:MAG: M48 family metalloprotease [Terriglobales bacterium]